MAQFYSLEVGAVRRDTRECVAISLSVPAHLRDAFRFAPGQYLTLKARIKGQELRRNYSICSVPGEETLTIAVKRASGGAFSGWANESVREGDSLEVMPPAGRFIRVQSGNTGRYLGIVAGSGITPVISILKATLRDEPTAHFTLIYGNRAAHSVMFREQLEDLKNIYLTRLSLVHVLSREQQDVDLLNGRIDSEKCAALFQTWVDVHDLDAVYLCGPQAMMDDASDALRAAGVSSGRIHREVFLVEGVPVSRSSRQVSNADAGECVVTVIQDGRSRQFSMQRGLHSILRAGLAQGLELPWSCQAGVCSTCRCKVVEGEVEMDRNFALEDYEMARGFRLACQSYPIGATLTIDYDQHT